MATLQEIQAAMTGFPRTLNWNNFANVAHSPDPPHQASTSARWSMSGWTVHIVNNEYRVQGARVTVSLNNGGTWATPAGKTSAPLLRHEQGHYDITGLVARDLIRKVFDLSLNVDVVAALRDSGNTPGEHRNYVTRQFQSDINRFGAEANAMLARLQTNPTTHADGIYDVQTNHGQNATGQQTWNNRLQHVMSGNEHFELRLRMEGLIN
jgi:hypothetical protein